MINIGINGFGRIGKLVSRLILRDTQCKLVSINHPSMTKHDFTSLLKYDSAHGIYNYNKHCVDAVNIHNHSAPIDIRWEDNINVIIDTTGKFKEAENIEDHLLYTNLSDDTNIIVSAPSKTLPMFVYGANHMDYNGENNISAASCTTTCLAPIVKLLHNHYGITGGLATTIHSVTASQFVVDKYTPGKRTGRTILNNIIPSTTGSASSIGKIIPELDGKINAISVRVPVQDVSLLDLVLHMENSPSLSEIMDVLGHGPNSCDTIDVTNELLVSSDYIGSPYNAIIDVSASIKQDNLYKIVAWYDNEMGYATNILRLIKYIRFPDHK